MYIYIASRPHSGSTILDIILGNHPEIWGCGEVVTGLQKWGSDYPCSCGVPLADCTFWQRVKDGFESASPWSWQRFCTESVHQSRKWRLPMTMLAGSGHRRLADLAHSTRTFAESVCAVSGRKRVLDSSKVPSRAWFLVRFLPEARLIHIVRDPRQVLASHWWRFRIGDTYLAKRWLYRGPFSWLAFAEAAMMWSLGNLICEQLARRAPGRVIRIRYEDLRDRPGETLTRIGEWLELDCEPLIAQLADPAATFPVGHKLAGNGVRLERQVRFDPDKERRREPLPRTLHWLTLVLCGPLMRRYGYSLQEPGRVVRPTTVGLSRPDA